MADTVDSKSAVARRVGSSPTIRIYYLSTLFISVLLFFLYSNTPTQINCRKSQKHTFDTPIEFLHLRK